MSISTDVNYEHQSSAPKKHMNTSEELSMKIIHTTNFFFVFLAMSFKIEFFACGLTSVNRDIVILGIEDFSISVNIFD
jgi:hypothetical protein